ncbi:hypothetical protein M422DRAFT_126401, partial [Sphaerobolus stellatus SS14]
HCPSSFGTEYDLARHKDTHMGNKRYKCAFDGCNRKFTQKGQLAAHLNTHTQAKPYSCNKCPKSFSDPAAKSRHQREQHGGVFYEC